MADWLKNGCRGCFLGACDREPGGRVNLAGRVKNLFLVTIDVYRLVNRKIEVFRASGGGGTMGGFEAPDSVKFHK